MVAGTRPPKEEPMHWLDFVLLLVLGFGMLLGLRSGLLWQVARVVTFALAIYACVHYHTVAADWLASNVRGLTELTGKLLAYLVTFVAVYLVCFLVTHLLERALRAAKLKPLDRLLGAAVGVLKAGLLAGGVLMGVAVYAPDAEPTLAESKVAPVLLKGMRVIIVAVPQQFKDRFNETLDRIKKDGTEKLKEHQLDKPEERKPDPLTDPLD
jgi:membrane protein required for colicin V production